MPLIAKRKMRIPRKRLLWACLVLVVLFGAVLGRRALRERVDEAKSVKRLSEYGSKIYAIRTLRVRH